MATSCCYSICAPANPSATASSPFLCLFPSLNDSFPPYLLCIKIGNLKLSPERGRELVRILTPDIVIEENIFNVSFTTSSANGYCSNKAAVKVLLANPNLLTWKRARKPQLYYLREVLMQQGSPILWDN